MASEPANRHLCVPELGSGPGFLAERLLRARSSLSYVALDYSAAMHELTAQRLDPLADRVQFVERNLRDLEQEKGLGSFDFVVTTETVHELRQKRHAAGLHTKVRAMVCPHGRYMVCDHYGGDDGMANDQLYMSIDEQKTALRDAG